MSTRFILVDDDPVNNMVCKYTIKKVSPDADIMSFEFPAEGLKYILSEYSDKIQSHTILFLDINMPEINGWEFLDEFSQMNEKIHKHFTIYIVSSSIDPLDKEKAKENIFVKEYLEKPIKKELLESIITARPAGERPN